MRKAFLGIIAMVIVLSVCAATAFAAGPGGGRCFADMDGDGICDNRGIYYQCSMTESGCGSNFTDADGDGICDNYVSGQGQGGCGCGSHRSHGNGFRNGRGR